MCIRDRYKEIYYGVTTLLEPYKVTVKGDKKKGFGVFQSQAKSNTKNDYVRYKVEGNIIGLGYETSENGGIIEIYVNRVLYRRIDTKSESEEVKYILISSNLTGENEIKVVNSNGGDVALLGVITSGDNRDSKEVENLNNILARNTGDYSGQQKNTLLYEDAKIENNEVVATKKEQSTPVKIGGNTQTKPSTNVQSEPSTSNSSVSSNNVSNEVIEETQPIENIGSNEIINNEGGGIDNSVNNVENNATSNIEGSIPENNTTNNVVNSGDNNQNNGGGDNGNNNIGNETSNNIDNNESGGANNTVNNNQNNTPSNEGGEGNSQNSINSSSFQP